MIAALTFRLRQPATSRAMRSLVIIPFALLGAGCWTPGPGELDPTRYPWDQRPAAALKGSYCIVSLELPGASGITIRGGSTMEMACNPAARDARDR